MKRQWLALRFGIIGGLLAGSFPAAGDPPPGPPACNVTIGPVFCQRLTHIQQDVITPNKFRVEFEIINWTGSDAHGVFLTQNVGPGNQPTDPYVSNALYDFNGRPMGAFGTAGASIPPAGNTAVGNNWTSITLSAGIGLVNTRIEFRKGIGTPIPHPTFAGFSGGVPTIFHGLLDPAYASPTSVFECVDALAEGGTGLPPGMIPGSIGTDGPPGTVTVPDSETIDNGPNIRDGFIIEISDWDPNEQISFNWHLVDAADNSLGIVSAGGAVMGDAYGFGAFNLARINSPAPEPLFSLNSGYDPPNDDDPDQDSPLSWAEDEGAVTPGVDAFPINPIASAVGTGKYFAVEFGAAVTSTFKDPADNSFMFGGVPVASGVNLPDPNQAAQTPTLSPWAIAAMTASMLIAGAAVVRRRRSQA